jgi:transcriptional regulator with XRE-family HTH domain
MAKLLGAIRNAIRESGESRYAISKATGIDQAHLSRLLQGTSGLSLASLETLIAYLDLEIIIRPKRKKGTHGKHHS